jgi:hypothetical protein
MDVSPGEQEAVRARIHDALGVRVFKSPPEQFDPLEASDRELVLYGYPARPDREDQPDLYRRWAWIVTRPATVIEPQFAVTNQGHAPGHKYGLPAGNGWAASIAWAPKDDAFSFVSGQWNVPNIAAPKPGNCICSAWVGIDGANDDPLGRESTDILQAGTTHMGIAFGPAILHASYAWFEWYPADPVTIPNFPVAAGDTMHCLICVYSPTEAFIFLLNLTSQVRTSFVKIAPKKVELTGNSAEWVVECPVSSNMNLARYGDVYFDNCLAGTQGGALRPGGTGSLLNMYDSSGHDISVVTAETETLVKIEYSDASP